MSSLNMRNESIVGWRVRARIATGCHVEDTKDSEGFRNVEIPAGIGGTLTGDIWIWTEGVDSEECRAFAEDSSRIRDALQKELATLVGFGNYREIANRLSGDDKIAAHVALRVRWDGIAEREPGTLNCASYIPWLELTEDQEVRVQEGGAQ